MRLLEETKLSLTTNSHLDQIELKIAREEKNMFGFGKKEVQYATVKIFLAELFGNTKLAAIIERYYTNEMASNDYTSIIKSSYSSIFRPNKYTKEEEEEWERNKKLL